MTKYKIEPVEKNSISEVTDWKRVSSSFQTVALYKTGYFVIDLDEQELNKLQTGKSPHKMPIGCDDFEVLDEVYCEIDGDNSDTLAEGYEDIGVSFFYDNGYIEDNTMYSIIGDLQITKI